MKKTIMLVLMFFITLLSMTGCTKDQKNVLNYFNDQLIVKIEYVEYNKNTVNDTITYREKYIPLQIDDLDAYVAKLNTLKCKSPLIRDYNWKGSGDIQFYYQDGSTIKWDGTEAKYIDKDGKRETKYFENTDFWKITSQYTGMQLNLHTIISDKDSFILLNTNSNWINEDGTFSLTFGEANDYAYFNPEQENLEVSSYVYENKTYITNRIKMDKIPITKEARGTLKYKDSILNVKLNFVLSDGDYTTGYASIYYLNNKEGNDIPNLDADNLLFMGHIYYSGKNTFSLEPDLNKYNLYNNQTIHFSKINNDK